VFNLFSFSFVQGNAQNAFAYQYSLVVTENTARKLFGNISEAVGKKLLVDNKNNYTITAVVKDMPANSSLQFAWLAPYGLSTSYEDAIDWGSYGPLTYVELDKKADLKHINQQLQNFIQRKRTDQKSEAFLYPMSNWRLYDEFQNGKSTGSGRIREVRFLSTIAWIILLIACINYMNLATASSQKRAKEIGIHKTLGASKGRLIVRLMGEAMLMSLLSALVAILLVIIALPVFNLLMQKQLLLNLFSVNHITALLAICLITGLFAGSYPSFYLSSFNPLLVLKGMNIRSGFAAKLRKALVVIQFTISIIFISSTIIVYQQVQHIRNRDLGLNKDNLIEINMQHGFANSFSAIKQDLLNSGTVENAAMSDHATLVGGDTDNRFRWQGKREDNQVSIAFRNVSPEYIATSGMKIIEGRDFNVDAPSENKNVIISKSFAKLISDESVVGKIIQSPRGNKEGLFTSYTIVGVVDNYVFGNVFGTSQPVLLFCKPVDDANLLYVRQPAGTNVEQSLAKIAAVIKKHNADYPFQYKFVDDQFNQMYANEVMTTKISGYFALLAIIISCLGLFGLAAFTAEQRTKEIGVRKVLGASVTSIARLLSKDFIQLVLIACLLAFPLAWWYMHDWISNYEYRVTISSWIFVAAGAIAIFIALFTVSFQAIKAAMANPIKSLRTE
jgi:ABC-type antimicrobial peptide transport system permease subunit